MKSRSDVPAAPLRAYAEVASGAQFTVSRPAFPWHVPLPSGQTSDSAQRPGNPTVTSDNKTRPTPHPESAIALLGSSQPTNQHGLLGFTPDGHPVAMDIAGCHTICLFGLQGWGKSYTLGVLAEMATMAIPGANALPAPLATLVFHYHRFEGCPPELLSARHPNDDADEVAALGRIGIVPQGLGDVVCLVPAAKVERRRRENPGLDVRPLLFGAGEVGADGWRTLLAATGNDALYLRQIVSILRRHREGLDIETIREELDLADLPPTARRFADDRLALAAEYLAPDARLADVFRAGRIVIVDLRDDWTEKDEALALFVVLMRLFCAAGADGSSAGPYNRLVVFDEAHKYMGASDLITELVETVREARHQGTSVIIASQDPLSVPRGIIELSSTLILHRMTSPLWLKHLKGTVAQLTALEDEKVACLGTGEAFVWSQRSTHNRFKEAAQHMVVRPRATKHGGATRTASVDDNGTSRRRTGDTVGKS